MSFPTFPKTVLSDTQRFIVSHSWLLSCLTFLNSSKEMVSSLSRSASWMALSAMLCSCSSVTCISSIARNTYQSHVTRYRWGKIQRIDYIRSLESSNAYWKAERGIFCLSLYSFVHIISRNNKMLHFYADDKLFYLLVIPGDTSRLLSEGTVLKDINCCKSARTKWRKCFEKDTVWVCVHFPHLYFLLSFMPISLMVDHRLFIGKMSTDAFHRPEEALL